jgi:hypothetical protein
MGILAAGRILNSAFSVLVDCRRVLGRWWYGGLAGVGDGADKNDLLDAPTASAPFALYRAPRAAHRSGAGRHALALYRAPGGARSEGGRPKGAGRRSAVGLARMRASRHLRLRPLAPPAVPLRYSDEEGRCAAKPTSAGGRLSSG